MPPIAKLESEAEVELTGGAIDCDTIGCVACGIILCDCPAGTAMLPICAIPAGVISSGCRDVVTCPCGAGGIWLC